MVEKLEEMENISMENVPALDDVDHFEEDDDSDEEPEDISLKEGKRLAEEKRKVEKESTNTLHKLKKQKLKEREERNILQQQEKRKRKPDSIVPEKLDDDILKLVDDEVEVNAEDIFSSRPSEPKNQKIIFNENDDSEEEDEEGSGEESENESEEPKQKKVIAKCLKTVDKEENNSAREFIQNHFFGDRLSRDVGRVYRQNRQKSVKKCSQTNTAVPQWLKDRKGK